MLLQQQPVRRKSAEGGRAKAAWDKAVLGMVWHGRCAVQVWCVQADRGRWEKGRGEKKRKEEAQEKYLK